MYSSLSVYISNALRECFLFQRISVSLGCTHCICRLFLMTTNPMNGLEKNYPITPSISRLKVKHTLAWFTLGFKTGSGLLERLFIFFIFLS